ncbi:MAG TPA: PEP/pyruvate-binding domain-containing protein [Methanofastidiosum sp.]|nr:PEP/pyruvate-binding domain-containing protein [Methanofastidiosum sp.]
MTKKRGIIMSDVILPFSDVKKDDFKSIGNKALNISLLQAEGFSVPYGFVVTTDSYNKYLSDNNFKEKISELLRATNFDYKKSVATTSNNIKGLILSGEIDKSIKKDIEKVLSKNKKIKLWAVRSSALAEDLAEASFAGQQDSFLNINSKDVVEHIKLCWASYWNERAISYRHNAKISHLDGGMAVIVQSMVDAKAAGVMFTADPITGDRDKIVIESSWGLGESIVSGIVSPDMFTLEKKSKEIIERKVSSKAKGVFLSDKGSVAHDIEEEKKLISSLTDEEIIFISNLGEKIETYFNAPQDIEWAVSDDGVSILQSRGITTIEKDNTLWTRGYSDEYWADVTSPLFFSLLGENLSNYVFKEGAKIMGYKELRDKDLLRLHKGHVYFNAQALEDVFTYNPKLGRTKELLNYFPKNEQERIANADAKLFKRILAEVRVAILDPDGKITSTDSAYLKWANDYLNYLKGFDQVDFEKLTDEELHNEFLNLRAKFLKHNRLIRYGMVTHSIGSNLILKRWLTDWLGDKSGVLYSKLITGLPDNKTIVTNIEMAKLAKETKKDKNAYKLIKKLSSSDFLNELKTNDSLKEYASKYNKFMEDYGHRSHTREIYYPRWIDDPSLVIEVLKSLVDANEVDLEEIEKAKREERKKAEIEITDAVSKTKFGFLKKPVFSKVLDYAQRYLIFRENQRFYLDHELTRERRLFMEYGRRFLERDIIDSEMDIFFFSKEEIFAIAKGDMFIDKETIFRRKEEFEKYKNVLPPKFLKGNVEFDDSVEKQDNLLKVTGTSSSPGIATGVIRVVETIRELPKVKDEEILVTSNTDPGWTPVFSKISGLITETGGILSHGAVVSREYGIPAVTAVSNATKIFKNGQKVKIDGNDGVIYIMEES